MPSVTIDELQHIADYVDVERLQLAIWNDPRNISSKELMVALRMSGGLIAGARSEGELVGFVLGIPTSDPSVQHSRKLGVLPDYRQSGTAARLKHFQRQWSLDRGINEVVWTFDPLKGVNANLNLHKLGATASEYLPDHYGPMGGIDAGAPSDRVLARWRLHDPRVATRTISAQPSASVDAASAWANAIQNDDPVILDLELDTPTVLVRIPDDWDELRSSSSPLAGTWRSHSRQVLEAYYSRGYASVDFHRSPNAHVLRKA